MSYTVFREPDGGRPRPGLLRRLVRDKRAVAGGVAVVAIVVAAGAVYLVDSAADPEPSNAANTLAKAPTSAAQMPLPSASATPSVAGTSKNPGSAAAPWYGVGWRGEIRAGFDTLG